MGNIGKKLIDLIVPFALIVCGAVAAYSSLTGGQSMAFMFGGLMMVLAGAFMVLLKFDLLNSTLQKGLFLVFLPLTLVTAWMSFRSIQEPIEFNVEKKKRYEQVITALKNIRSAQLAYRTVNKKYAENFDQLEQFVLSAKFPVVKALGHVPDSLTEEKAVQLGIVSRDTFYVSVRDSLFPKEYDIKDLRYVPFSEKVVFKMGAGEVERGTVKVPVFEASVENRSIFPDIEPEYYDPADGLRVGSMSDPSTSGNWE